MNRLQTPQLQRFFHWCSHFAACCFPWLCHPASTTHGVACFGLRATENNPSRSGHTNSTTAVDRTPSVQSRRQTWWLVTVQTSLLMLLVVACAGASCNQRLRSPFTNYGSDAPVRLEANATVEQIIAVVNENTARVQSYASHNAQFSIPGLPGLPLMQGSIAIERPQRFRLQAGTTLGGPEVDMGSNDQIFWMWAKRNDPPAVYFGRHAELGTNPSLGTLPIKPQWVTDALGLVSFNPQATYRGPVPRPDGTVEIATTELGAGASSSVERVFVIDATRGWVTEQYLYDSAGTLIVSAVAKDFEYHPQWLVSLPRSVTLKAPAADLNFTIDTGSVILNSPVGDPGKLYTLPKLEGYPQVDLGGPPPAGFSRAQPSEMAPHAMAQTAVIDVLPPPPDQLTPGQISPSQLPRAAITAQTQPQVLTPANGVQPAAWEQSQSVPMIGRLPTGGVAIRR